MPAVSRAMIRSAMLWLGFGTSLGALTLAAKAGVLPGWLLNWRSAHAHMLLVGWLFQFAAGVAIWMLPRFSATNDRGNLLPVWIGMGLLNAGVLLALWVPILPPANTPFDRIPVIGALLDVIGTILLFQHLWRRVLPFRTLPRPT